MAGNSLEMTLVSAELITKCAQEISGISLSQSLPSSVAAFLSISFKVLLKR